MNLAALYLFYLFIYLFIFCIVFKRKENDISCQHLQNRIFAQIPEFPDCLGKTVNLAM